MDITPEQYDELQRVTKQKAEDDADGDTPDGALRRCERLVDAGGARARARHGGARASAATRARVAGALCNVACAPASRGALVQVGLSTLLLLLLLLLLILIILLIILLLILIIIT